MVFQHLLFSLAVDTLPQRLSRAVNVAAEAEAEISEMLLSLPGMPLNASTLHWHPRSFTLFCYFLLRYFVLWFRDHRGQCEAVGQRPSEFSEETRHCFVLGGAICWTSPGTANCQASAICNVKQIPTSVIVQDLYPLVDIGLHSSPLVLLIKKIFKLYRIVFFFRISS